MNKRSTGGHAEDLAVAHLKNLGMKVVQKNYRAPMAEIDIIATDGDTLVFIEVKARGTFGFGSGLEAVDNRKQAKIKSAALYYLSSLRRVPPARFDIISIDISKDPPVIDHLADAFSL